MGCLGVVGQRAGVTVDAFLAVIVTAVVAGLAGYAAGWNRAKHPEKVAGWLARITGRKAE